MLMLLLEAAVAHADMTRLFGTGPRAARLLQRTEAALSSLAADHTLQHQATAAVFFLTYLAEAHCRYLAHATPPSAPTVQGVYACVWLRHHVFMLSCVRERELVGNVDTCVCVCVCVCVTVCVCVYSFIYTYIHTNIRT